MHLSALRMTTVRRAHGLPTSHHPCSGPDEPYSSVSEPAHGLSVRSVMVFRRRGRRVREAVARARETSAFGHATFTVLAPQPTAATIDQAAVTACARAIVTDCSSSCGSMTIPVRWAWGFGSHVTISVTLA